MELLEFNKIIEDLSHFAISEKGKEMVQKLEPSVDLPTINHWLNETTEAKEIIKKSSSIPLHHLKGIDGILQKLDKGGNLNPGELSNIVGFLKNGRKLKIFMKDKEFVAPTISTYASSIYDLNELSEEIEKAIRYDQVDDNATPKLSKIRKNIAKTDEKIKEKLHHFLSSSTYKDIIQENIVSIRDGHYVIPIKNTYKNNIEGNVLDRSSSGSTVYVEPKAVKKLQEELNQLRAIEEEEVYQILTYLTGLVVGYKQALSINMETMAHYDFIFAKAKYSQLIDGNQVKVNTKKIIKLYDAKHPLIGKLAVPLDFNIGEQFKTLVITGPNTGGKTVTLKTVGLLTMMVQSGLHVPAGQESSVSIYTDILVDIGDGQSIEQSLSTFSSHISNIISIIELASKDTLVILDELGAGTDPSEGTGLAISILEQIHQQEATTIATTHFSEIKHFATDHQGFENASMEFDVHSLKPTYKLNIGRSGESNAFLIALRLGMKAKIIERAHEITYKETKTYDYQFVNSPNDYTHKDTTSKIKVEHLAKAIELEKKDKVRNELKKLKQRDTYQLGDSVLIKSLNSVGIVCELEDNRGEIGVMVKQKKLKINKKRVSLLIEGKELYPEDYDLDIVFETKENRKKSNLLKRKHVEGMVIFKELD